MTLEDFAVAIQHGLARMHTWVLRIGLGPAEMGPENRRTGVVDEALKGLTQPTVKRKYELKPSSHESNLG